MGFTPINLLTHINNNGAGADGGGCWQNRGRRLNGSNGGWSYNFQIKIDGVLTTLNFFGQIGTNDNPLVEFLDCNYEYRFEYGKNLLAGCPTSACPDNRGYKFVTTGCCCPDNRYGGQNTNDWGVNVQIWDVVQKIKGTNRNDPNTNFPYNNNENFQFESNMSDALDNGNGCAGCVANFVSLDPLDGGEFYADFYNVEDEVIYMVCSVQGRYKYVAVHPKDSSGNYLCNDGNPTMQFLNGNQINCILQNCEADVVWELQKSNGTEAPEPINTWSVVASGNNNSNFIFNVQVSGWYRLVAFETSTCGRRIDGAEYYTKT